MFSTNDTEFLSQASLPWMQALCGQLTDGGAGAAPEVLGPVSALQELDRVCETMLAGRGGPYDEDRKSLVADIGAMRGALGPMTVGAIGPTLNTFIADLRGKRLATPQGARSLQLALNELLRRIYQPAVSQAAWDDVVDVFADVSGTAEIGEQRIAILRELCEARGHAWFRLGTAHRLTRLLSDDLGEAVAVGAVDASSVSDWRARAGLDVDQRVHWCREVVAEGARRGDVAVWLLFRNAFVDFWQRIGPVELFNAHLMPNGIRAGGNLERVDGYEPPRELEDWDAASPWLGELLIGAEEHAVLARVWLPDTPVEQAPEQARELVQALVEVSNEESRWVLQEGEAAYRFGGDWYGSLGFYDPSQLEENRRAINPVFEGTRAALDRMDAGFVERLIAKEPGAEEALEDARWVIAVARAPTVAQRVALGTRALERSLGIAQAEDEHWSDVTTRFLLAPWLRLQRWRWLQAAASNARRGVSKTHGRGSPLYAWVDDLVFPEAEPGRRYMSAEGVAGLEFHFGPLATSVATGLAEHRLLVEALGILRDPRAALAWLRACEDRFGVLLRRTQRCRNAVIHGQRPNAGTLVTVDEFVRDLGRLVAQESMRSAESRQAPLVQLERWRAELAEQRARLETGEPPLTVLFAEAK